MHAHSRKQSVDTATHNAEGKWGRREKNTTKKKQKNRTCLQGRLKIKRNTIPACIWVEASLPLPPGRLTRSKSSEDLQSTPNTGSIPLFLLPSDRALGLLFRPKPSIQLPWLRSLMEQPLSWSGSKIASPSVFLIQVVHGANQLLKPWQENSAGVKIASL